jgi:RNA polymerase sigma factor (sigma-70 family)
MGNVSPHADDFRGEPGVGAARRFTVRTATVTMSPAPRPEADASDGVLVRRVAAGDHAALEALYDRYGRPAFALARRITGEPVFAEEVVQEVFLALWREPGKYDPERGGFPSWLLATTHHKAVDAVRREETVRRRRAQLAAEADWFTSASAADVPPVEDAAWAGLRGERVRQALGALPPAQREALVLAYYAGYTQREIAERTNTPLGTVKTRMLAGMRKLRDLLDGVSDTEGVRQ